MRNNEGDWWNAFEYFSVAVFTVEYVLRIAGAAHNPACGYSRLVYATTFIGIVDLLSILPFYLQLVVDASNGGGEDQTTAEIFRVVRIFRLLELEHFLEAFTLLDDVFRNCKDVMKATGVVALVIWVGGAALFWPVEKREPFLPRICSRTLMDAVACDLLFMLTCAILMTSSQSKALRTRDHCEHTRGAVLHRSLPGRRVGTV